MRQKELGNKIRKARERLGLNREQAAKKVGISPGYLALLECESPVPLSEGLLARLQKKIRLTTRLNGLVERQNLRAKKYTANRKKAA